MESTFSSISVSLNVLLDFLGVFDGNFLYKQRAASPFLPSVIENPGLKVHKNLNEINRLIILHFL